MSAASGYFTCLLCKRLKVRRRGSGIARVRVSLGHPHGLTLPFLPLFPSFTPTVPFTAALRPAIPMVRTSTSSAIPSPLLLPCTYPPTHSPHSGRCFRLGKQCRLPPQCLQVAPAGGKLVMPASSPLRLLELGLGKINPYRLAQSCIAVIHDRLAAGTVNRDRVVKML